MAVAERFVVDLNVGRLAKWLRVMGYDTLFPREADDNDLVRIALQENRLLVTRDSGFSLRRVARQGQMRVLQIADDGLRLQLRQLVRDLNLDLDRGFSRCIRCNELLTPVKKEAVAQRVPPYVYSKHQDFRQCAGCHRVYWRGTHWSRMLAELQQVYQEVR
jgi:uncharacterized protein with PIN domain